MVCLTGGGNCVVRQSADQDAPVFTVSRSGQRPTL